MLKETTETWTTALLKAQHGTKKKHLMTCSIAELPRGSPRQLLQTGKGRWCWAVEQIGCISSQYLLDAC